MAKYDIIIKNGTVFDGKGNSGQKTDVGVKGDEIKKIGDLQNEEADTIIDATGNYISPGFIDLTTHSDTHWSLFLHPLQESFVRQGITTILGGNCGLSLAPLVKGKDIEGLKRWVDISKININWQTMPEFFSEMEKHKLPLNFCTLVGFNTLHRGVMAGKSGSPNSSEIAQMKFLLDNSLKSGAFGISTSFGSAYSLPFSSEEIIEIFKVVVKNNAVSKHHLEDEGKNILPSISKLISFARESKVKLHISHFKALGKAAWRNFDSALDMIKSARQEGIKATCDFFPYERTGSNLFMLLPSWARKIRADELLEILRSPGSQKRKDAIDYLVGMTLHYDKITIASGHHKENIGKTILEISKSTGLSSEEVILNLLAINNLQVSMFSEVISEKNIDDLAKQEFSVIASDGAGYDVSGFIRRGGHDTDLAHPRSFGAFPRALRIFAKEKKILSWEEIIHKMTGLPAQILSLKKRGIIEKGNYADIVVFNPGTIKDRSDYFNPYKFPEGVSQVLVNGEIVFNENSLTGKSSGRILKSGQT